MSSSIILLDQNFNASGVDSVVFETSLFNPLRAVWADKKHGPNNQYSQNIFGTKLDISFVI